jgi:hypothetical protein
MKGDYFARVAITQSEKESLLGGGGIERVESFRGDAGPSRVARDGIEDIVRSKSQTGEVLSQQPHLRAHTSGRIYRHQPASG